MTDLTGNTTDDGSIDLANDNENTVVCVTANKSSIRTSREISRNDHISSFYT